jgi:predicted transporter
MIVIDVIGAWARAAVDRLAFVVESLGVSCVVIVTVVLAATRFDLYGAAYVWGFFWVRVAKAEDPARLPVLGMLAGVWIVLTALVGCVRWRKASRAFDDFPPSLQLRRRMLERLG